MKLNARFSTAHTGYSLFVRPLSSDYSYSVLGRWPWSMSFETSATQIAEFNHHRQLSSIWSVFRVTQPDFWLSPSVEPGNRVAEPIKSTSRLLNTTVGLPQTLNNKICIDHQFLSSVFRVTQPDFWLSPSVEHGKRVAEPIEWPFEYQLPLWVCSNHLKLRLRSNSDCCSKMTRQWTTISAS